MLANKSNTDEISKDKAIEIANSIYEDIGVDTNEYELDYCREEEVIYNGEIKEVWSTKINKKYDGIVNPYEGLSIDFISNSKKIEISSIYKKLDGKYENNPEVITKEEAIKIACEKEKIFTDDKISEIDSSIGIRKANKYIYDLEKNITTNNENMEFSNNIITESENRVRKVWIISIYHEEFKTNDVESYLKSKNKSYYIDATTGEIIGGYKMQFK